MDPEFIGDIAESVNRFEKMGIDDSSLFFWDDDFAIVFEDGFVNGISGLVNGKSEYLGYGYEDVCSIFTDAGIKAPLLLVGTEAAFDVVGEVTQERVRELMKSGKKYGWEAQGADDIDDLPFN